MVSVCQVNFGVTFLLSEKIEVNGKNTHLVFSYLKTHTGASLFGNKIKWNFTKFLISRDGSSVKRYAPTTTPLSIKADITGLLG
jgi:glutathione peroxidase